jgi:hypothetical protein
MCVYIIIRNWFPLEMKKGVLEVRKIICQYRTGNESEVCQTKQV